MLIDEIEQFKTDLLTLDEFYNVYLNNQKTLFDENTATIFIGTKQLIAEGNQYEEYSVEVLVVYAIKGDLKDTAIYRTAETIEDKVTELINKDFNDIVSGSIRIHEEADEMKGKLIILHSFKTNYMKGA
jgi:hypothetical protein